MDPKEVREIVKAVLAEERAGERTAELADRLEKVDGRLKKLEQPATDAAIDGGDKAITKEDLAKIPGLLEKIEKGLSDMKARIEKLERKPGSRNGESPDGDAEPVRKSPASRTAFNILGVPDMPHASQKA